jgi:hypothetical protein
MKTERFYPPINEQSVAPLKIARRLALEDPDYLKDVSCPYGLELRDFLTGSTAVSGEEGAGKAEPLDSVAEIEEIYRSIKDYGVKVKSGSDPSDKNTYFRIASSLLEKLITLKERAVGVKNTAEFTAAVLDILEEQLSADARSAVITRLKRILSS